MDRKTAVVTGSSRGIGRAIAIGLAKMGINIVVNYAGNAKSAQEVVAECIDCGVDSIAIQADVSKFDECKNLIDSAIARFGSVDILVNNAGITKDNLILRMGEEDFDAVIDTNLKSIFNCSKLVARSMMKARYGRIINLSSVVGVVGNAGQVNYSASKAGVIGFTKSLAKELGSRNITVNAVAPGFIKTDMTDALDKNVIDKLSENIALGYLGDADDVANAVCFLASDNARYITGEVLKVTGGMGM